jgi:MFS family permease
VSYLGELRRNVRPLIAASLGVGTSLPFDAYTNSIFAPYLIEEFGWERSQFALYGLVAVATAITLPFIGRLTDRFGVRPVAMFGTLLMPLVFVGYSQMQGSFGLFLFLSALKLTFGHMTGAIVYTRLIAQDFDRAQGLALTIVNCTPAALGALAAPVLIWSIESYGWRLSYPAVAMFSLVCGVVALSLIPGRASTEGATIQDHRAGAAKPSLRADLRSLAHSRVFWIIFAGMYLCMLATPLQSSQLTVMLRDNGLTAPTVAWVVSVFAVSSIAGRILCGLALDRFPTPLVTTLCMIAPALGFFLLATDLDTVGVITFAMVLAGFAVGAENDLMSFLIARYFKLRIYSSTGSLLMCCVLLATTTGSLLISASLAWADSFSPFLYLLSGTVLAGSLLFLLLPKSRDFEKVG